MSEVQIDLEMTCEAPAGRLWNVLLKPDLWWGEDILLEPRPGGKFYEPWRDGNGEHHTHGRVLEIEPVSILRLSWWDSDWTFRTEVQFQFQGRQRASSVNLCHHGWKDAPDPSRATLVENHRRGWVFHLGNLVRAAERVE